MSNSSKIKILHIIDSFNIGGLENGVVNLINRSNQTIFNHEICCITKSGNAALRLKRHINIYEMHKQHGRNDWRLIFKLIKLFKARQPDIIHTRNWGTIDGIIAAKLAKVPILVHSEHGWNIDDPDGQNSKRRLARRILSFGINHFIAVSENIRQWLIKSIGIEKKKITKISNGVDTAKFCPSSQKKFRTSLGLKDEIVIGTVGRLDPIKRHDLLLQAFSRLDHKCYNLRLILVGDGPEGPRLHLLREKLPISKKRIILLGGQDNIVKFYNLMDIFVLPSRNEGMSNTIIEAMAVGLPIVATLVGGNPELVSHDKTGFLIPIDNCEAIQNAIKYYLDHPETRKYHGLQARLEAEKRFSLCRMIGDYEKLYRSLYFRQQ